jgi:transcriptional regulator with XRE-family HTH domain
MEKLDKMRLMQLSKRLKHYRKLRGYSNYEHLAFDVGISRSQYGKYENGGNIKYTTLCKILNHLNVSLEDFFNEGFNK